MQLSVRELKLLVMALPYGLSSEHLTQEERRCVRELVSRMVEHVNEVERNDAIGHVGGGRLGVVRTPE